MHMCHQDGAADGQDLASRAGVPAADAEDVEALRQGAASNRLNL